MNTVLKSVFCLLVLFGVTFGAFLWMPASMNYHITERYVLNAGEQGASVYLGLLEPISGPYQRVRNRTVEWQGEQQYEIKPCVEVVKLSGELAPGSTSQVVIDYDVRISYGVVFWNEETDECLLESEAAIESDHPLIEEQASKITLGRSLLDVYRVYDYVIEHMTWSGNEPDCVSKSTALEAYQLGVGSCCEYSRLMVALCRASDIPSRAVSGIQLPYMDFPGSSQVGTREHPGEGHAWVEFSNGYLWTMADPTWGTRGWQILQFMRSDGRHLRYGGADMEAKFYQELRDWATQQAPIAAKRFSALKYVLASDSEAVQIIPEVTVRKGWDGRWLNTVVVLAVTTILLCYVRDSFRWRSTNPESGDQEEGEL
jgi:hypothetical protein